MRKRVKQILGWGHAGCILSMAAPVLYGLVIQEEAEYEMVWVWLLNLLVLLVVAGTDLLVERCRRMEPYLFFSVSCAAAVNLIVWKLHGLAGGRGVTDMGIGVAVIVALESVLVFVERILIRLYDKKRVDRQEKNPDWQPRQSMLTDPQVIYMLVFVLAYGVGKFCNNPLLGNIAVGLAPVYLCIAFLYRYLEKTEEYLFLNHRVCNLPKRRLYGINGGICLAFLSGIVCVGIFAGAMAGYRNYQDIRDLLKGRVDIFGGPPAQLWEELSIMPVEREEMPFGMEMEVKEPPAWMKTLEKVMTGGIILLIALLGVYGLRQMAGLFRETYDENGDLVEDLEEEETNVERISLRPVHGGRGRLTEAERIRRQYRRTIRRYRKEQPGCYETPYEIEAGAGIADTEEGQRLHQLYERMRYHL